MLQRRVGGDWPDIGEKLQGFSKFQQSLFRSYFGSGIVIVPGMTDRTEKDGVAFEGGVDGFVRKRVAGFVDSYGAHQVIGIGKFVVETFRHCVQHFHGLACYFRTDPVSFNYNDVFFHTVAARGLFCS